MPQTRITLPAGSWVDVGDATTIESTVLQNRSATGVHMRIGTVLPDPTETSGFFLAPGATLGAGGLTFKGNPGFRLYFRGPGELEYFDGT